MKKLTSILVLLLTLVGQARATISLVAIGARVAPGGGGTDPVTFSCSTSGLLPLKVHDLLILHLVPDYGGTATFAVTVPSGWIIWPGYPNTSQLVGTETSASYLYYQYYNGGNPNFSWTVSAGHAGSTMFYACRIWQWRGTNLVAPNDGSPGKATTQSATTITAPSVTAAVGDALMVLFTIPDHAISISGSPTLTVGYNDTTVLGVAGSYLTAPSAGATTGYVGTVTSSSTLSAEQVLIAPPAVLSTSVLYNSCASTGCAGVPPANGWAYDPLAQILKLNSDNIWATMS